MEAGGDNDGVGEATCNLVYHDDGAPQLVSFPQHFSSKIGILHFA